MLVQIKFAFASELTLALLIALGVSSSSLISQTMAKQDSRWDYPGLRHSISIRDGRTDDRFSWEEMIAQLASAEIVFLGETHDDDTTHRFQLGVYQDLLIARQGNVVLAMEMFERDVQSQLDRYLDGTIDEVAFLATARPWGNYREAYRPLVEHAKAVGKPVIAANFPRPLLMKMSQAGDRGLDGLGDQRKYAPEDLRPNSALYWKRVDNATRGHSLFMKVETDERSRLLSTQSLWDNAMGAACAKALQDYPHHQVLHLNGGFHSEYWDGTVAQARSRNPDATIKTVAIRPATHPHSAKLIGEPIADYVVFVESRAKNLNDGDWKVVVDRENSYLLHLPAWASVERPAPLLIWLSDDGLSTADNLGLLKAMLGSEAAIAIVEPTHRQRERDLSLSGRWFWPDRFAHDIGVGHQTVESVWQYLLNRFPVDPQRVCLAGEGTGATLCAAVAMGTGQMELQAIAMSPRQYAKIKDFPLPLRENWGSTTPPQRRLIVVGTPADRNWWETELAEYESIGIQTEWVDLETDPWLRQRSRLKLLKESLGLAPKAQLSSSESDADDSKSDTSDRGLRKYLVADTGAAKEVHWLRMLAAKIIETNPDANSDSVIAVLSPEEAQGQPAEARIAVDVTLAEARQGALPLCPGPFGGTTILVIDEEQAQSLDEWLTLESNDPLNSRSRFHRTRISVAGPKPLEGEAQERSLSKVLEKLLAENRKNVLIVPASFYAGQDSMGALAKMADPFEDQMTLQWLPGLGGNLPAPLPPPPMPPMLDR